MASTIGLYSSTVDVTYPIAGINQSSQGFRSNFAAIKGGLDQAATEITNLQGKLIVVTGDVSGTSISMGSTNAPVTLSLILPDLTSAGTINSLANNIQATVNTKGQITSLSVTAISTNVDNTLTYGVDVTSLGTGTGTANFPNYKFDAAGKVTHVGTTPVTYGVQGHPANRGKVVAGDLNSKTALTPVPGAFDGTYVLTATGNGATGLEWVALNIPQGTVVGITQGPGIAVQQNSANPTISADFSTLPTNTVISDVDSLPFQSFVDARAESLTVGAFKTYIAQSFLASDVGSTHITSTDAGGVVINSAHGITLNGVSWPTVSGTQGQVLTLGPSNTLVWQGSSNATVAKTFYVSNDYGDDTTGTGGFTTPYKTITKALSVIPPASGPVYVVALLAGTYTENFTISALNVAIKGVGGVAKAALTGVATIGGGTNFVGIENVKFDRSAQPTSDLQPALYTIEDMVSLQVLDCDFIRGAGTKAVLPIVSLSGDLSNGILFDGCAFQGQVDISMVPAAGTTGRTVITNVRQLGTRQWGITVAGDTTLRNIATISGITHLDGDLVLEEVGEIVSVDTDVTLPGTPQYSWTGSTPNYDQPLGTLTTPVLLLDANGLPIQAVDGSANKLYQADGVTPLWQTTTGVQTVTQTPTTLTATPAGIYSTSNVGALTLHGVSMSAGSTYSPIYKTGSAPYTFTSVDRRADLDFIAGPRVVYEVDADNGNFMPRYEADFNGLRYADDHTTLVLGGKLDPTKAKVVHVTLVGANAHLSLKTPAATSFNDGAIPQSSELVTEFKVFVQQDGSGGHHMIWSADSEPEILWYTDYHLDDAPNAMTVFTFYYHSVNRQWIGMRTSKGADRRNVFTDTGTTFVPTLQHANSFISLNNAAGIGFQINGAVANFPVGTFFEIEQDGAGVITVTGLSGQNIFVRTGTATTAGQYAVIRVTKKNATDWIVSGDHG
jgi:hypothetical protein